MREQEFRRSGSQSRKFIPVVCHVSAQHAMTNTVSRFTVKPRNPRWQQRTCRSLLSVLVMLLDVLSQQVFPVVITIRRSNDGVNVVASGFSGAKRSDTTLVIELY